MKNEILVLFNNIKVNKKSVEIFKQQKMDEQLGKISETS